MPDARTGDSRSVGPPQPVVAPGRMVPGRRRRATLALLLHATAPWQPPVSALGGVASLMVWCTSPYAGLAGVLALARRRGQEVLVLLASLATTGFGLLVLGDVLLVHQNPVNALASLAVPWVQWVITLTAGVGVVIWRVAAPRSPAADRPPVKG